MTGIGNNKGKVDTLPFVYLCITSLMRNQVVTTYGLKKVIKMEQVSVVYLSNSCPETCLNGANQSVDAQDNQYDTLLLSCSVTQIL